MATNSDSFLSLDDYIVSLADGVAAAQQQLQRASTPGPGGASYTYVIPKLEFELRLEATHSTSSSGTPRLAFAPARATTSSTEIHSILRGSIVAVPVGSTGDGAHLEVTLLKPSDGGRGATLVANVADAAGAPISNLDVEFNLDREETAALNPKVNLERETRLKVSRGSTDASGTAKSELVIDKKQASGFRIALVVDAGGLTKLVVHEVSGS